MSTRCSVIIDTKNAEYMRGPTHHNKTRIQYYHHMDGYVQNGVWEELFEEIFKALKNSGQMNWWMEMKYILNQAYEPEHYPSIHIDWEYLYYIEFTKHFINFYVKEVSWDEVQDVEEFINDFNEETDLYASIKIKSYTDSIDTEWYFIDTLNR